MSSGSSMYKPGAGIRTVKIPKDTDEFFKLWFSDGSVLLFEEFMREGKLLVDGDNPWQGYHLCSDFIDIIGKIRGNKYSD